MTRPASLDQHSEIERVVGVRNRGVRDLSPGKLVDDPQRVGSSPLFPRPQD